MTRLKQIQKLAKSVLSLDEYNKLTFTLPHIKGWGDIDSFLNHYGFERGDKFSKDKYFLSRDGEVLTNAFLSGNHEGVNIHLLSTERREPSGAINITTEVPESDVQERSIPYDAFFNPSAIYERWEEENDA